jgi:bifunctional pyridoxal-dependent enzyme with beta-cystathionase and maltose regulon repressor activities
LTSPEIKARQNQATYRWIDTKQLQETPINNDKKLLYSNKVSKKKGTTNQKEIDK